MHRTLLRFKHEHDPTLADDILRLRAEFATVGTMSGQGKR
jgi:hypothetical protein